MTFKNINEVMVDCNVVNKDFQLNVFLDNRKRFQR